MKHNNIHYQDDDNARLFDTTDNCLAFGDELQYNLDTSVGGSSTGNRNLLFEEVQTTVPAQLDHINTINVQQQHHTSAERIKFTTQQQQQQQQMFGTDLDRNLFDENARIMLNEAIERIPFIEKTGYLEAFNHAPHIIENESNPLTYLRYEGYNVWNAAQRLVKYWEWRKTVFLERSIRPLLDFSGEGAMNESDLELWKTNYVTVLPKHIDGSSVIFVDRMRVHDIEVKDEVRSLRPFFMALTICNEEQKHEMEPRFRTLWLVQRQSSYPTRGKNHGDLSTATFPMRFHSLDVVFVPRSTDYTTLLKMVVPAYMNSFRKYGTYEKLSACVGNSIEELRQYLFETLHFDPDNIPTYLGGTLDLSCYIRLFSMNNNETTINQSTTNVTNVVDVTSRLDEQQQNSSIVRCDDNARKGNLNFADDSTLKMSLLNPQIQPMIGGVRRDFDTCTNNTISDEQTKKGLELIRQHPYWAWSNTDKLNSRFNSRSFEDSNWYDDLTQVNKKVKMIESSNNNNNSNITEKQEISKIAMKISRIQEMMLKNPSFDSLSESEKMTLLEVMQRSPYLVESESNQRTFIEFHQGDSYKAIQQMSYQWNLRTLIFGNDRAFLHMNQTELGALNFEDITTLQTGFLMILPENCDGQCVLSYDPSRASQCTFESQRRCFFYMMFLLTERSLAGRKGITVLVFMNTLKVEDLGGGSGDNTLSDITKAFPIKFLAVHVVLEPVSFGWFSYQDEARARICSLFGGVLDQKNVHFLAFKSSRKSGAALESFGYKTTDLPESLGGNWTNECFDCWQQEIMKNELIDATTELMEYSQ